MDKEELMKLIAKGENSHTEFKESYSSDVAKEICAFANADGGKVLLGVTDKNEIKGIEITNRLKSQIHDLVSNFDPPLDVSITEAESVLIIEVPDGKNKPYSVKGNFYLRKGTNSPQMNTDEIREFFQKEGLISFDEAPNNKFDLEKDFNAQAFQEFLRRAGISRKLGKKQILTNLEIMDYQHLKNTGVLFFAKKVSRFFPSATIVCALFQGTDKVKILDRTEFDGVILDNFEEAIAHIRSKLNTEYIIRTAGPREEKTELPEEALREALLNAICHRDYYVESPIFVEIYSDRLEIVNAGGLVPGMSMDDLGKKSKTRNRKLFGLMQRTHMVEKAGTGIIRIREAMKNYRLPLPEIEANSDWFSIIFKRPDLQKESYEQRFYGTTHQVTPQVTPQVRLTVLEAKILKELKSNPRASRAGLASILGIRPDTVQEYLQKLKKKKLLERKGKTRAGYWEVKK